MITCQCSCGNTVTVAETFAGRSGTCRKCGATMRIPAIEARVDVAPPPPLALTIVPARKAARIGCFGKVVVLLSFVVVIMILGLLMGVVFTFHSTTNHIASWMTAIRTWLGF